MKKLVLFLSFMLIVSLVQARKIGVLNEVLKPDAIEVSGDRLYVVGGSTFYVYSLKNLEFISKFGRKGAGPGELLEFAYPNNITLLDDKILVEGFTKIAFFSKDFKLLKEIKKKGWMFKVIPVGKNFAAIRVLPGSRPDSGLLSLSLLDAEFNPVKELHKQEISDKDDAFSMANDTIHFVVYRDKIYVEASNNGFVVNVFDSKGTKELEIKKNLDVRKSITGKDKEALFENLKNDRMISMVATKVGGWENFRKRMTLMYPDAFPLIKNIVVGNGKIYVSTNYTRGSKEKYVIMDMKGKIVSTVFLPIPGMSTFSARALGADNRFYSISNNKYYHLAENDTTEDWELHVTEIK
ncbi:MAG: hypothetical protein GY765_16665 [bacterium]|nr:hypothetical protein [bacterium]